MLSDPSTIEPSLDLILISRHLERIGDHATNIAEDVIFMVSARDVRHHLGTPVGTVVSFQLTVPVQSGSVPLPATA